jgi:hypothetical protein
MNFFCLFLIMGGGGQVTVFLQYYPWVYYTAFGAAVLFLLRANSAVDLLDPSGNAKICPAAID